MTLPLLVAVCFTVVVVVAVLSPMLRRLAVRGAVRRPGETVLVIVGSLLGTALITGSFIVGDTLDTSIKATAYTQLGPVDELVNVPRERVARALVADLEERDEPSIDGVMSIVVSEASLVSSASGERLAEPDGAVIEMDFAAARAFGRDPGATGIRGPTPAPGRAVITDDLADALEATAGDRFTAYLYGNRVRLEIDRILPQLGLAGFWTGGQSTSPNAFVSAGTIDKVVTERLPPGAVPPVTTVLVSNRGDVEGGARLTGEVERVIRETLPEGSALRVETVKDDKLERAEEEGKEFGELFLAIGSFAIIAGILLLVNIFVMLAEERKSELGMLRAVGMRRSHLIRAFVIEGALYSLTASVLGAGLGIGVGWAIVKLAAPIFGGFGDFSLDLTFDFTRESIVVGFCAGALISLATVTFTSFRISRINIIRAIRDLPEPKTYRARVRAIFGGGAVAAVTIVAFVFTLGNDDAWFAALAGPPIAAFGLLPSFSRIVSRKTAVLVVAAGSLAWGIFGNSILGGQFFDSGEIFAFVIQGVLLTFSAVVLLTQLQETLEGGIRKVAARRLPLRLSVAYPLARRFRTGLTLGMFALVIFTMTFIATLANVFGGQVESTTKKEGDFEILARSNRTDPPSVRELSAVEGVTAVASLLEGAVLYRPDGALQPEPWFASAIDRRFVEGGPPVLSERAEGFADDREVWEEVVSDPRALIVPAFFLQMGGGIPAGRVEMGDTVEMIDPLTGRSVERKVVGEVENDFAFSGSYVSKESLREVLGERTALSRFYVATDAPAGESADIARSLQGRFVRHGVEARTFRSIVEEFQRSNLQFLNLMQAYLALGLLVGIAGLGVVMVRAVRERRREVGVLRSLGFLVAQVRRAFVLESGFVALEGTLIGAVLAIVTSSQLIATDEFGENVAFIVPWGNIALLVVVSLVAALVATAWPAQQASKTPPAAALRSAE